MVSIKEFIVKFKKRCHHIASVFDDSHDYETAVETLLKESNENIEIKDNFATEPTSKTDVLYAEPTNEYKGIFINDGVQQYSKEVANKDSLQQTIHEKEVDNICLDKLTDNSSLNSSINDVTDEKESNLKTQECIIVDEKIVGESKEVDSLIINTSLVDLIEELDQLSNNSNDDNITAIIDFCQNRIIEILLSNGCKGINEIEVFDPTLHVSFPFAVVPCGVKIKSYIRIGVMFDKKVLLKAKVKLES